MSFWPKNLLPENFNLKERSKSENDIEITRLKTTIEIYERTIREILAENAKLKEINEKLSDRLSWKCECKGCFNVK